MRMMRLMSVLILAMLTPVMPACSGVSWDQILQTGGRIFGYVQDGMQVMQVIGSAVQSAQSLSPERSAEIQRQVTKVNEALQREARAAREARTDLGTPQKVREAFPDFIREFNILEEMLLEAAVPFMAGGASGQGEQPRPPRPQIVEIARE